MPEGGGMVLLTPRLSMAVNNSPTVLLNLQRASPFPSVGPSSNDANTVSDTLEDRSEGLELH